MTSPHFNLNSASSSRENMNLTIQLCHLSIHPEQSRVNKGQKGFWQTHQQGTSARFPGTKISYIIQVDATPLSVQFEHQHLMRQNWGSGWNMPPAQHTCRREPNTPLCLILPPVCLSCPDFLWGDKLQQEQHFK